MQRLQSIVCVLALFCAELGTAAGGLSSTGEECRERGGVMQKSPEGQSICLGDISRYQCYRLIGEWKKPRKGLAGQCQFDATAQERIDACRLEGGDWGRHGAYVYYCLNTKMKVACLKKGGNWDPYHHGENVCVLQTVDAGKVCHDAKDCQAERCLYNGITETPLKPATGSCAPTFPVFGCEREVRKGKADPSTACQD